MSWAVENMLPSSDILFLTETKAKTRKNDLSRARPYVSVTRTGNSTAHRQLGGLFSIR
jgi:hypothetical protein